MSKKILISCLKRVFSISNFILMKIRPWYLYKEILLNKNIIKLFFIRKILNKILLIILIMRFFGENKTLEFI